MQRDYKIIIADTSCIILLSQIDEIEILRKLFSEIYITPTIQSEFGKALPSWIKIQGPENTYNQQILELEVDAGEASAIALSFEIRDSLVILDDDKARKLAERLFVNYTGTFGIFIYAKKKGIIRRVKPILENISKINFRFSEKIINAVLKQAGERTLK